MHIFKRKFILKNVETERNQPDGAGFADISHLRSHFYLLIVLSILLHENILSLLSIPEVNLEWSQR